MSNPTGQPSPAAARGIWEITASMYRWAGLTPNIRAAIAAGMAGGYIDEYTAKPAVWLTQEGRAFAAARGWK